MKNNIIVWVWDVQDFMRAWSHLFHNFSQILFSKIVKSGSCKDVNEFLEVIYV